MMGNIKSKKLSNSTYNCYIYLIFGVKLLQIGKPTPIFSTERYVANREFLELYIASSNSYYYELYESYLVSSQGRWNKGYIIGRAIRRHD